MFTRGIVPRGDIFPVLFSEMCGWIPEVRYGFFTSMGKTEHHTTRSPFCKPSVISRFTLWVLSFIIEGISDTIVPSLFGVQVSLVLRIILDDMLHFNTEFLITIFDAHPELVDGQIKFIQIQLGFRTELVEPEAHCARTSKIIHAVLRMQ